MGALEILFIIIIIYAGTNSIINIQTATDEHLVLLCFVFVGADLHWYK